MLRSLAYMLISSQSEIEYSFFAWSISFVAELIRKQDASLKSSSSNLIAYRLSTLSSSSSLLFSRDSITS